jgi:hypothetical protein
VPSNILITAGPSGDTLQCLKQAFATPVNGRVEPTLVIDFSCITNVRIMIDAWRQQIDLTGEAPVNLVLDMTEMDDIGSWDRCLSGVFDTRVFGADQELPKAWNVALLVPACELENLPACSTLAGVIIDGSHPFGSSQLCPKLADESPSRKDKDFSNDTPSP